MERIKAIKYKEFNIYFFDANYCELAKKIIDKEYIEIKKIKDTKRNIVSLIEIDNKKYIYKEPRNESIIPQRKFFTLLKKGEALNTLININYLIEEKNIKEFVKPLVAVNIRKKGFIFFSFFLMEYIDGKDDRKYLNDIIDKIIDIHSLGYYHGDFNPGNFLVNNNGIHILDTQGKKMKFGNYRAHYDMLTMKMDSYEEMTYPYKKNIYYYLAYIMKKLKKLPFIEKIKKFKKNLRNKGWKI